MVSFLLYSIVAYSIVALFNSCLNSVAKAAFAPTLKELLRGLHNSVHARGWPLNKVYLLNGTQVGNVRFFIKFGYLF